LNKYERFACDWFLSQYPKDLSYTEVQAMIDSTQEDSTYDDNFLIWNYFENEPSEDICELMDDMVSHLTGVFK
jgi:hypothetical protein